MRDRIALFADVLVLLMLTLASVWASFGGAGFFDTFRDLSMAQKIADGSLFPLAGPPIYNTIHVGPLWYYLLGFFVKIGGIETAILGISILLSLKYWIAYRIGWVCAKRAGAWAALGALLAFGWGIFESIWLNHASMVCTLLCLLILICLPYIKPEFADRRDSVLRSFAVGLCVALCFHAHPTTAIAGMVAMMLCLSQAFSWRKLLAFGCGFVLLFLTYFIDQFQKGLSDFSKLGDFVGAIGSKASLSDRLINLGSSVVGNGWEAAIRLYLWDNAAVFASLLLVNISMVMLLVYNNYLSIKRSDYRLLMFSAISIVAFIIQGSFLVLIRPETPFWMSWSLSPPIFALTYFAFQSNSNRLAMFTKNFIIGLLVFLTVSVYVNIGLQREKIAVVKFVPGKKGLMDIAERVESTELITVGRLYLDHLDEYGRLVCSKSLVRGHLASFIDQTLYISPRQSCGHTDQLVLGGTSIPDYREVAYMGHELLARLQWRVVETRGIEPVRVTAVHSKHQGLKSIDRALGELRALEPSKEQVFKFKSANRDAIALFQYDGFSEPFKIIESTCNGKIVEPIYSEGFIKVYAGCTDYENEWQLRVFGAENGIDVFSFNVN